MAHELVELLQDLKHHIWVTVSVVGVLIFLALTGAILLSTWYLITLVEANRCRCQMIRQSQTNNQQVTVERPIDKTDVIREIANRIQSEKGDTP